VPAFRHDGMKGLRSVEMPLGVRNLLSPRARRAATCVGLTAGSRVLGGEGGTGLAYTVGYFPHVRHRPGSRERSVAGGSGASLSASRRTLAPALSAPVVLIEIR